MGKKKHESVFQSYPHAFVCLYIWYWNNGKKNLDWIGSDETRCRITTAANDSKNEIMKKPSSRMVERSTIVISTIHFCLVRLARRGHLFYSIITFVELNHGSELCTIIVRFDFITITFSFKNKTF